MEIPHLIWIWKHSMGTDVKNLYSLKIIRLFRRQSDTEDGV